MERCKTERCKTEHYKTERCKMELERYKTELRVHCTIDDRSSEESCNLKARAEEIRS